MTSKISSSFDGVTVLTNAGDTFFIYDPDGDLPPERQMPFATVVTDDNYEKVSRLDRPDVYRLNIGVTKATYTELFGPPPTKRDDAGVFDTGFDYAAIDLLMPHPVYASQYWVCVLNPSEATVQRVEPMLREAYGFAVRKHTNHQARAGKSGPV